jgi:heme/copper-type cytochrome/quinol oxidase subunit 2
MAAAHRRSATTAGSTALTAASTAASAGGGTTAAVSGRASADQVEARVGRHAAAGLAVLSLCAALSISAAPRAQDELDLTASRTGFRPRVLNLRKGEPVRLRLTTEDEEHCLAVDAFRIEKRVLPGKNLRN